MLLSLLLVFASFSFSEELIERSYTGVSDANSSAEARNKIIDSGILSVSRELLLETIGEEKYRRNSSLIYQKIIKSSGKYIPVMKTGKVKRNPNGEFSLTIDFKVSLENLQSLLLAHGLMYANDGRPVVIPMIQFIDRVNLKSYKWWTHRPGMEVDSYLEKKAGSFYAGLEEALFLNDFYLLRPIAWKYRYILPETLRLERPRDDDWQFYGQYFNSEVVVSGTVIVRRFEKIVNKYQIQVRMQAKQASNGRVIAELEREIETEEGLFEPKVSQKFQELNQTIGKDLASQILQAWQKGTFGAQLITLEVGRGLSEREIQALSLTLKKSSRAIKTVKERYWAEDKVRFEMDVTKSASEIAGALQGIEIGGKKLAIKSVEGETIKASY